jgi:TRAP-type uncharacterized transport system fused permease subunit
MFVYEPALLMIGDWPTIVWRFILSCVGIGLLAAGLHGYLVAWMPTWQRAVAIAAAFLLVVPQIWTDLAGIAIGGVLIAYQLMVPPAVLPTPVRAAPGPSQKKEA